MGIRIPRFKGIINAQALGAQRVPGVQIKDSNVQSAGARFSGAPREDSILLGSRCAGSEAHAGQAKPLGIARPAALSIAELADDEVLLSNGPLNERFALRGNERWFLVYTLPKREIQALMRLRVQGFKAYLPQYLRTTRHARQLRTFRAPLFPRYLFIVLDLERDRWLCVRGTIGVSSLVGCDERPLPVPRGIIEALIAQGDDNGLIQFGDGLQAGQKVRIASGPFADFVGTLDRLDDTGRVRLLLDMMGSEIAITLPRSGILPAA